MDLILRTGNFRASQFTKWVARQTGTNIYILVVGTSRLSTSSRSGDLRFYNRRMIYIYILVVRVVLVASGTGLLQSSTE